MAISSSLLCSSELRTSRYDGCNKLNKCNMSRSINLLGVSISSNALQQDALSRHLLSISRISKNTEKSRRNLFQCRSSLVPSGSNIIPALKNVTASLTRSYGALNASPILLKLAPAVSIIAFAVWGVGPLMRLCRIIFLHKNDNSWKKSRTNFTMTSYIQPLLLWTGAILVCRVLDPIVLPTEASQAVKQRVLNFVRSLSSVMAFAYCLSSLIQQAQTFFIETNDSNDTRNMGFQFAGKAVYSAVWVAAVSLFMELLGFSTQKWLTAGGLGTVLLTLAGREIFTNFLSSIMIHATRPFVLNEWIQTKIEGYEVSGTVEHVGWWSPTIIRGDDREAIHIPNHKFTMNVVRNLSQKTHWRIKNYLAISHLDVNKINNIVADMRKVLAKNPLVEQQRLHRRVFLENINPENQALMILVSCFVKTSHFEEYLCVKEAVILDLLRVISHHRARLATPIRTVQKVYAEADSDTIFSSSRAAANRPLLLIEPSYKINGEDKAKVSPQTTRTNEDKEAKPESKVNVKGESTSTLDPLKSDSGISNSESSTPTQNLEKQKVEKDLANGVGKVKSVDVSMINSAEMEIEKSKKSTSTLNQQKTDEKIASSATSSNVSETKKSDSGIRNSDPSTPTQNLEKQKVEKDLANGAGKLKSVDVSMINSVEMEIEKSEKSTSTLNQQITDENFASSAVSETKKSDSGILNSDLSAPTQNLEKQKLEKDSINGVRKVKSVDISNSESSETETEKSKTHPNISPPKQDGEKTNLPPSRPSLEDNILLGVALEGSKRTLPIEEEMTPVQNTELKEMSRARNVSNSTSVSVDRKEEQIQSIPSANRNNELEKEG